MVCPLSDNIFLLAALAEARRREGFCAPNPAVGAVLVNDQRIVARGYHWASGCDHAEVACFKAYDGQVSRNHTLYVSLEPCCHQGKTPPCTDAIIASGVGRVVFAHQDPNPKVAGKSSAILQAAGIQCELLPLAEVRAFYRAYDHWHTSGRAQLAVKLALTLNGVYGREADQPLRITGEACQVLTHQARRRADALLTTVQTVLADDPLFNVREEQTAISKPVVVLDRQLQMPLSAQLWQTARPLILLHGRSVDERARDALIAKGAHCLLLPLESPEKYWQAITLALGELGYYQVWAELGGIAFTSLWQSQMAQDYWLYVGQQAYTAANALALPSAMLEALWGEGQGRWFAAGNDWVWHFSSRAG